MATRKKKYQEIHETLNIDDHIFESNVDNVIKNLQALKVKYNKHTVLYLELDADYNHIDISLSGKRPETDKERDDRLLATRVNKTLAAKRQRKTEDEEKAEFFRLHEKFGHLL